MKGIIILLLSFLLILTGCNPYPKDQTLESYGYDLKDNGNYVLEIGENDRIFTYSDANTEEPAGIATEVYIGNFPGVSLTYNYQDEALVGHSTTQPEGYSNAINVNANDMYAYIKSIAPEVATELEKLAEYKNISTESLKGGDKTIVEALVASNIKLSNAIVSKSNNIEFQSGSEELKNGEYFLQVNFDITNNTNKSIAFSDLEASICYSISSGSGHCDRLPSLDMSEKTLSDKLLKPGATASIQFTPIALESGYDFYIGVNNTTQEGMYASSDIMNK